MVCSVAKVTPPVCTVTVAVSPSAMLAPAGSTALNAVRSLAEMVMLPAPIGVAPWLAASAMTSPVPPPCRLPP